MVTDVWANSVSCKAEEPPARQQRNLWPREGRSRAFAGERLADYEVPTSYQHHRRSREEFGREGGEAFQLGAGVGDCRWSVPPS